MPRKIRELIAELERAGFDNREGKGSHRKYRRPLGTKIITISGNNGDDAKSYQEKQIKEAISEVKGK